MMSHTTVDIFFLPLLANNLQHMSRTQKDTVVDQPPDGIECTPEGLVKAIAGCFGFLLSVVMVVALCLIAVGIFWTAQNFDRMSMNIKWDPNYFASVMNITKLTIPTDGTYILQPMSGFEARQRIMGPGSS